MNSDPHHPMAPRIQQHVEGMMRLRSEILDESGRKRAPDGHPGAADVKRQRMTQSAAEPQVLQIEPLPPGRHSLGDVFTLTGNDGLKNFDILTVPADLVAKINVSTLTRLDAGLLAKAIEGIRARLAALAAIPAPVLNPDTAPLGVDDDDDDEYEPDFHMAEDTEQILNKLDGDSRQRPDETGLALKSFKLPAPPSLTPAMAFGGGQSSIMAMLEFVKTLEDVGKRTKSGVNRMAASNNDRESWMAIITRIASRSPTDPSEAVKEEGETKQPVLANSVREMLYNYVMEDFRRRIDVAITWLTEEWYADELDKKEGGSRRPQYEALTIKLIDGFSRYLHAQDKVLTRFLGELPHLTPAIMSHVKTICRDPSVVNLVLTSLLYLVMMRPPAKDMALDTVQDIWLECEFSQGASARSCAYLLFVIVFR